MASGLAILKGVTQARLLVALALWGAFVGGCGGYVGHAKRAYVEGRYLEASEMLAKRERDIADLMPRGQAEYGIYRGLSSLMLGDNAGAHRWLTFSHQIEKDAPGTLTDSQKAELRRGLVQLARAMGVDVPAGAEVVPIAEEHAPRY